MSGQSITFPTGSATIRGIANVYPTGAVTTLETTTPLIWQVIGDGPDGNWVAVSDGPSGGWTEITDSPDANWIEIDPD